MRKEISEALGDTRLGNRQVLESALGTTEVMLRIQERLIRNQISLVGSLVETGVKQFRAALEAETPAQMVAMEWQTVADFTEKMVITAQETLEIFVQAKDEYLHCCDDAIAGLKTQTRGVRLITNRATGSTASTA